MKCSSITILPQLNLLLYKTFIVYTLNMLKLISNMIKLIAWQELFITINKSCKSVVKKLKILLPRFCKLRHILKVSKTKFY